MTDLFLDIATVAAVSVQVAVGIVFFGALATMTLLGFGVFPAPY